VTVDLLGFVERGTYRLVVARRDAFCARFAL